MFLFKKQLNKFIVYIIIGILFIPNFSRASTLLTDNFTGSSVNLTKWTIIGTEGVNVIQNNNMNVRNSGGSGVVSLNSVSTFSRDNDLTVSANMTATGSFQYAYLGYGDSDRANGNAYYVQYGSTIGLYAIIMVNGDSSSIVDYACSTYTAGAKISLKMITNGFEVYKNDILACSVTGSSITNKSIFLQGFVTGSFFDDLLVEDNVSFSVPSAVANLSASEWGNTTTNLTWTAPSNGGDPITDYTVDYRVSGNIPWTNFVDGVSASIGTTVTGLTNGVTYEFRVRAINGIGTAPDSNIPSVTVSAPIAPSTPVAPTASTILSIPGGTASVAFSAPSANGSAITSYTITSSPGGIQASGSSSPIVISGLTSTTSYTFTVTATNGVGTSSSSSASNAITPTAFPSGKISWTERTNSGQREWRDVAMSSDGVKLVALDFGGYIYTSTDSGANWIERTLSGQRNWWRVASSADGVKLVAANYGGYIYTSTDSGANWTARTGSGQRQWTDVTSSADGVYLVAAATNTTNYYSTDSGVSWTASTGESRPWSTVSSSSDGSIVYIAPEDSSVHYSPNYGLAFANNGHSGYRNWSAVTTSSDGVKIAGTESSGYVHTSTNSGNSSWTQQLGSGSRNWSSIDSSSNGDYIIASADKIFISLDGGVNWTTETSATGWKSVAMSSDGLEVVAVAQNGYIYTGVVDITLPTITNVSSNKSNGSYSIGEVIDIDVTFSEAVTSTGNVTVTLETGSTDRTCTFTVTNSTTGTCNYTVVSGDTTSDLTINTISGTIADQYLNTMTDFAPATNLAANKALVIDTTTTAPTMFAPTSSSSQVNSSPLSISFTLPETPSSGSIQLVFTPSVGSPINIQLQDVAAFVTTTFNLPLTGGISGVAEVSSTSNEVISAETYGVVLSYQDFLGNAVSSANATGVIIVEADVTPPTITNVSSDKANGSYTVGEVIDIDVTFSEAVTSTGNVTVTLETGTTDRTCTFTVSNSTTGTCNYTVQAGDTTADLTVSSIAGTIADQSSNAMVSFTIATNLASNKALVIDAVAPVISEITPVVTPATDTTPSYSFTTNEIGGITYGGSCSSSTNAATTGINIITFDILAVGIYADCTITVSDALLNSSNILAVTAFTITAPVVVQNEITPPGAVSVVFLQQLSDRLRTEASSNDTGCTSGNLFSSTTGRKCSTNTNIKVPSSICPVLPSVPKLLKLNMNNSSVKTLQQILNCKGYIISTSGAGSPGKETTLFGGKTREAVLKLQKENSLIVDGIVGNGVRNFLNK